MKIVSDLKNFTSIIISKKSAIYELAKRDFQAANKNTYLGILWGYVQPLTYVLLLVVVFSVGLRTNPGAEIPFVVYLITGMIAWQFFISTLPQLTTVVQSHSFLVKRGDFSLSILHISKILSVLAPNIGLMAATVLFCWYKGFSPDLYTLQLLYYLAAMFFLLLGLGWITSSTSIFVQDVSNIVMISTQFGFWFTPIIWNMNIIPAKYHWIIKSNPMCYIVTGYRDSLVYKIPFWSKPYETLYFWFFTSAVLVIGVVVFRKLKPHFGEVI